MTIFGLLQKYCLDESLLKRNISKITCCSQQVLKHTQKRSKKRSSSTKTEKKQVSVMKQKKKINNEYI